MKPLIVYIGLTMGILFLTGCGKDSIKDTSGTHPGGSSNFFANTEWTGVAQTYGQTYPQPYYLRFNSDTTVSVYALFSWLIGNDIVENDSVVGKITKIDNATGGQTSVTIQYALSGDEQVITFPDHKTLTGGSIATSSAPQSAQYTVTLQINPASIPDVNGSSWNTDKITDPGPTTGMYEFPDINGISFVAGNKMTYTRGGKVITYTPPTQDQLLIEGYQQRGPKLYFAGYNESSDLIIQYFGVLSADGQTIMADCRNRAYARLPNYLETIFWYGSPGVTPITHKAN
jgi:hypothetical protein